MKLAYIFKSEVQIFPVNPDEQSSLIQFHITSVCYNNPLCHIEGQASQSRKMTLPKPCSVY